MSVCRNCLRTLLKDTRTARSTSVRPAAKRLRTYATVATRGVTSQDRPFRKGHSDESFEPYDRVKGHGLAPKENARITVNVDIPSETPEKNRLYTAVTKELEWYKDPLKLADYTRTTLVKNDLPKALALVRLASKDMQCVVSWNHIVNWLMMRRQYKPAFKVYNEMKKRGQFPDSHTIILLLRGLAQPPVKAVDVGQAIALHHSLSAKNSRVTPATLHTNATLKVCAEARDMDSLWSVASAIPEKGAGAADATTFTTIIQAIHSNAVLDAKFPDITSRERMRRTEQAVVEGKRIWRDIIYKWKLGDLKIDEQLICAMGRLLLIGSAPQDWDNVLSLVEQTMDIPRLAPQIGSSERPAEHIRGVKGRKASDIDEAEDFDAVHERMDKVFDKIEDRSDRNRMTRSRLFAKPGNSTLSLICESSLRTMAPKIASDYWTYLTTHEEIALTPDLENYHAMFRVLKRARASARVVSMLETLIQPETPKSLKAVSKTYRLAMGCCNRDRNNPNALTHATKIIDAMEEHLAAFDAETLSMYLHMSCAPKKPQEIIDALARLALPIRNIKSQLSFGNAELDGGRLREKDILACLDFLKAVIATIDRLMNLSMVPKDDFPVWQKRRHILSAFVNRRLQVISVREDRREATNKPIEVVSMAVPAEAEWDKKSQNTVAKIAPKDKRVVNWRKEMPRLAQRTPGQWTFTGARTLEQRWEDSEKRRSARHSADEERRPSAKITRETRQDIPFADLPVESLSRRASIQT